jgi:hypothetical protein
VFTFSTNKMPVSDKVSLKAVKQTTYSAPEIMQLKKIKV